MNEIVTRLGEMAVIKMRLINSTRASGEYADNLRKCPWYSEFYGMLQTLKCMGIDIDMDLNPDNVYEMQAIIIMGRRFEV